MVGPGGIYTVTNSRLELYQHDVLSAIKSQIICFEQDADGDFWIGTGTGAYYLRNGELIHLTGSNGLTDVAITDIYNDIDNNLWLASSGNGLFKYEGDGFITFDRSQGMPSNDVVMGISKDKTGHIILGINGVGLMRFDGKKIMPVKVSGDNSDLARVQCLHTDRNGLIWITGDSGGLWTYDGKTTRLVKGNYPYVNGITEDERGTIWASTPMGCFYVENNTMMRVEGFNSFTSAIMAAGRDSVIAGTQDGMTLIVNKKIVNSFKINALKNSTIYCMLEYKNKLIIGTGDRGLFTWDKITGQVKNYTTKDGGLNSNTIYSLVKDDNGVVWVGTGRGANRMMFDVQKDDFNITGNGSSKNLVLESNQNSTLFSDGKVWMGTTKGAVVYNVNAVPPRSSHPHIIIQSVRLIPQIAGNEKQVNKALANGAHLSYDNSHLSISFLGVYLKDPESVSYRYKLKGLDSAYSLPVKNNVVDYPSLPAGSYTFEVMAVTGNGIVSTDTASFAFSITPPFYQTITFRTLAIIFFVLLGIGLQSYRHRVRISRQRIIEATKREESLKIRQQTAEDFHDELGNKLTRITVLSEILDTKMDQTQCDQKKLLEQIKQNAASLYNGTKDILWALDPQSDNLYEILNHIKDFGNELFLDTQVTFEFTGIEEGLNEIKLPMEYSRNIPMIFKELLNNILKHAHATHVKINLDSIARNGISLTLSDNGCGFDLDETRKGQGINNISTRIKRIGGDISIRSKNGQGTLVELKIKINPVVTH